MLIYRLIYADISELYIYADISADICRYIGTICCISHYMSIIRLEAFAYSPSLTPPSVIHWRSLFTSIMSTSEPFGSATRLCTHCCSPHGFTLHTTNIYARIQIKIRYSSKLFRYRLEFQTVPFCGFQSVLGQFGILSLLHGSLISNETARYLGAI